jgi:sulfhydrogenase subunit beta (sulfur reductase)
MEQYIISKESLSKLFSILVQQGKRVLAPVLVNGKIIYDDVKEFTEIRDGFVQSVISAKQAVFPRAEKLFSYKNEKDHVELNDFDAASIHEMVLWGIKPCDAAAHRPLNALFNWDFKDKLFNIRADKTTIISFSCHRADDYCFCTSVGGNPGNTEGSDIQMTLMDDSGDYLAEIITAKGEAIVSPAAGLFRKAADSVDKTRFLADVPVRFNHEEAGKKMRDFFNSNAWAEQSMRCLGCGACAFVCPVCACFDIQDEAHGKKGDRIRCWDSCGLSLFTLHTSGHNPREVQSKRWRQRLLHKFAYMPERLSVYGCTGCGRCSRSCPADMNIVDHIISMQEVKQ